MQEIRQMAHELRTQDNAATACPIFTVQQRRRVHGMDPAYATDGTKYDWIAAEQDYDIAGEAKAQELDAIAIDYDAAGNKLFQHEVVDDDGVSWEAVYYVDHWEFVTCCLTQKAAEAYIQANRHNLTEPRVYVESAHRNQEWASIRELVHVIGSMGPGVELIARERVRQMEGEGFQGERDDQYVYGELATAAMAYLAEEKALWPPMWDLSWFKLGTIMRNLVKAGALLAAELDRRARAGEQP